MEPQKKDFTYRTGNVYRDPGHLHICPVEMINSLLSCFMAFEADKAHAALWQDMGICDLKAACKMLAKLIIGTSGRKPTDKHPSVFHFEVLWLQSLRAKFEVKPMRQIFFPVLYSGGAVRRAASLKMPAIKLNWG